MERKKASDFPQELLNLFDGYVHGGISRRQFLDRAQRFAVGGVTAAALFQMLKPNYAWAVQVPTDDKRIKAEYVTVPSPQGNGSIKGYLVRPANDTKLPAVLVVHENRGLNPYIEDVARRLAVANYIAFAPDELSSIGGYPGDEEKAVALFGQLDRPKLIEDFLASATWLQHDRRAARWQHPLALTRPFIPSWPGLPQGCRFRSVFAVLDVLAPNSSHKNPCGRACPGHPRLEAPRTVARKTWVPGTRPGT